MAANLHCISHGLSAARHSSSLPKLSPVVGASRLWRTRSSWAGGFLASCSNGWQWMPTDAAMEGCGGGEDEMSDLLLFFFFSFPTPKPNYLLLVCGRRCGRRRSRACSARSCWDKACDGGPPTELTEPTQPYGKMNTRVSLCFLIIISLFLFSIQSVVVAVK